MGKNYRNRISLSIQTPPPSTLPEDPSKRKESTTNCNLSASTVSRTSEKSGECISCSPNSEKQPENCLLLKKKTPADFSKEPPFSTECTDMVSSPMRNSNSITCSVWPSINSWTRDCKPVFIKKASRPRASIKLECSSIKGTSELARVWLTLTSSWWEPLLRRRSIWLLCLLSRPRSPAGPVARKTKERKLRNDPYFNICHISCIRWYAPLYWFKCRTNRLKHFISIILSI